MEELLAGLLAGGIIFLIFIAYRIRLEQSLKQPEETTDFEHTETMVEQLSVPLEKKLRDAIYDCKQNILACDKKISKLCQQQLDLLQDIGKISHIEVKNKPFFFRFYNPLTQQQHFYYERDLYKNIDAEVLEQTQKLAQQYHNEITLIGTQKELFSRLIESHQENLDRINGIHSKDTQRSKLTIHKSQLNQHNRNNKLEESAIYNQLLLTGIQEELEHQDECLRQYHSLQEKYQIPNFNPQDKAYQIALQTLIEKLELEDPERDLE